MLESSSFTRFQQFKQVPATISRPEADNRIEHPPGDSPKRRMIEITLEDDRASEAPFVFKPPAFESLVASANRLLKFQFPVLRNVQVYERLIKTHLVSARLSKRTIENLPFRQVERIYRELWQELLPLTHESDGQLLTLYLMMEEMAEFRLDELVSKDIQLLGLHDTGPGQLHSYYYQGALNRENLVTLLQKHHYRTDFIEGGNEDALAVHYLACRRLTHPLLWSELLAELGPELLERYPRLNRLNEILQTLKLMPWAKDFSLTPQNFAVMSENIRSFLRTEAPYISAATQVPRPVRELVIVEGETEKLLLPIFGKAMGLDFCELGIDMIPAGGKNQVLALYREHAAVLDVPIFVVLDQDAAGTVEELKPILRPLDCIYQLPEGEFEDTYDIDTVLRTINRHYQPHPAVSRKTFEDETIMQNARGRVQALKAIWQSYNLGSFDKTGFAQKLSETMLPEALPPQPIQTLLHAIMDTRAACTGS